jgi:hypothetical protein
VRVNEIYREFRDRLDFYLIYIQEIHPVDGWQVRANVKDEILHMQPTTADERAEVASVCMLNLKFEMPMLLDNMDNEVDGNYAALPERLYVVDAKGNVAYRSEMGPWGFDAESWRAAIARQP